MEPELQPIRLHHNMVATGIGHFSRVDRLLRVVKKLKRSTSVQFMVEASTMVAIASGSLSAHSWEH